MPTHSIPLVRLEKDNEAMQGFSDREDTEDP